jgi:hypothetical protein
MLGHPKDRALDMSRPPAHRMALRRMRAVA